MSDMDTLGQDFAEGWRPSEGDKVVGIVTNLTRAYSDYSEDYYPVVTVHDEEKDQEIAIHCFHAVIQKKMKELKPKVGERIGVIYKGTVLSKDGKRTISVYDVKVEGRSADIWDTEPPKVEPKAVTGKEEEDDEETPF
jgi:hypothetical protein